MDKHGHRVRILPVRCEEPLRALQIDEEADVVVPALVRRLIHADLPDLGVILLGPCQPNVMMQDPPQPRDGLRHQHQLSPSPASRWPRQRQCVEEQREPAPRTRPGHLHGLDPVLRTFRLAAPGLDERASCWKKFICRQRFSLDSYALQSP